MDVLANASALGHCPYGVGPEVLGMRAREADAFQTLDFVQPAKQRGKQWMSVEGAPLVGFGQKPGQTGGVVRPQNHVDVGGPLLDRVPVLLRQAAGDDDLYAPAASVLEPLHVPEVSVKLPVGVLPDAARVEQHDRG